MLGIVYTKVVYRVSLAKKNFQIGDDIIFEGRVIPVKVIDITDAKLIHYQGRKGTGFILKSDFYTMDIRHYRSSIIPEVKKVKPKKKKRKKKKSKKKK